MRSKSFIIILILSILLVSSLVYINFFGNRIYFKDVDAYTEVEVFKVYKDKKINVCYGNKIVCRPISYKTKGKVDTKKIGTYTITYKATKKDVTSSVRKKVKVVDKTAPELEITGSFDNVCPNGKTDNITYKATDNYDGDITENIKYKLNNNKMIYKVTDSSLNTTTKEFDAVIKDDEAPTLILNDNAVIYIGVGSKYEEPGYVAIDNCDGNITEQVKVSGKVNTNKTGTYELTYNIKDEYGNETIVKRTVKVFPKNNYKPGMTLGSKVVYLTFDDGPGKHTQRLLDILKKYDAKVTFFVTGYDNKYNELLTKEHNDGHTVALHSYSHNYANIYSSVDNYMNDLYKISDKVKQYTNVESKIIRFPGGSSNTVSRKYNRGIMTTLTQKLEQEGYKYFDWTIASGDAGNTTSSSQIVKNVTTKLRENEPNVVLLHDIKSYTVDAIEEIIQYGLSNGYTFAPLTMDSPVVHQKVNN